jgi:GAF domain-containing protein
MNVQCVPRGESFCTHALDRIELLEVCDASVEPPYRSLPSVTGEPHLRYYLGAPLMLENRLDIGVLCVLDTLPRPPASRDQRAYLRGLARHAAALLERNVRSRMRAAA